MVARWGDAVGHLHWGWDLWWRRGGWRVADPPNSPQHLTWDDACAQLPRMPDVVFAVVRDPAARLVSEYRWQCRGRRGTKLGKLLACLPFSLWLRVMLETAQRNVHAFDNHLRPQSDFVPGHARVFRLEDGLSELANWLLETAGDHTADHVVPHALASGKAPVPTPGDLALIGQVFAVDYDRFGYCRPTIRPASGWVDLVARMLAPLVGYLDRRGAV